MIANLVRIQKEICRLINEIERQDQEVSTQPLEELAQFVNKMSPFEAVDSAQSNKWVVRNKKTLEEYEG